MAALAWGVRALAGGILLAAALLPGLVGQGAAGATTVILATTTSLQDSGLLDVLVPLFEKRSGHTVKSIAVGTGQALALASRGEADVVLAHAPALEKKYEAEGLLLRRRLVMANDFVLVGPEGDPAGIRGLASAIEAMKRIAAARARFVSRGDRSGTHALEIALWKEAGVEPRGPWYIESGQGMAQTLGIARERGAYTLADRATHVALRQRVAPPVLVEGDRRLLNLYSVLEVSPGAGPRVNAAGGRAFADFMLAPEAQAVIRAFGADRHGHPLFMPAAGKPEAEARP
ncbi:MAG: tungsten ABC transporter substrate-binding protein [Candidatus Rokubacteria bacterium GWC2_70_16]|nr:MAG: tungsten ABC transporter substrate-binding protein [Candidatus Rokubacteria bacterium GWC2_70_16]OGL19186.1 MAG: tungsten ABC transporter substrate-binding protein [Candidatus Rokubacteria bacterium RIFCSPLOWO2_12_FULL_71_19]